MAKDIYLIGILLLSLSICCLCGCATKEAPSTGTIDVSSSPQGAEVYLDNQYQGRAPVTIPDVPEGDHMVELRLSGYETWNTSGSVSDGDKIKIFASLERIPTPTTLPAMEAPTVNEWIWSRDGWGDWQHSASWTGPSFRGPPSSEYGPVMVNDHGEYGTKTYLLEEYKQISTQGSTKPSTQAGIWKTFTDRSGLGWDTLTFVGRLSGDEYADHRWMTIEVNGQKVFSANATQTPPGNDKTFSITVHFPQTTNATVKFSHGDYYSPGNGLLTYLECDLLKLSLGEKVEVVIETTKPVG